MTQATSSAHPAAPGHAVPAVVIDLEGLSLRLHLAEVGLACCAVEQQIATQLLAGVALHAGEALSGGSADLSPARRALDILVVSGTVTDVMAPIIAARFSALPEPRTVVSFGACAATGGPYWDSPVVTNGIDQWLPVELYVPGCPPRPEAFVRGLRDLAAAWTAPAAQGGAG